jgi:two-component system alkaline phosphatase synthesis response regulator PhoP
MMRKMIYLLGINPRDFRENICLSLLSENFEITVIDTADDFWRNTQSRLPDFIIMQRELPDNYGIELCRQIKNSGLSGTPLIMLSEKNDDIDKVLALELGADDYIDNSSVNELIARVKALMRRYGFRHSRDIDGITRVGKRIMINPAGHEVFVDGARITLTNLEFKILRLLASQPSCVFSRQQILEYMLGKIPAGNSRRIDVHVRHLRVKIGSAAILIRTVHGRGYKVEI